LPLSYFTRTKAGQILSRVLTDTAQTKQLITQIVTQSLQSGAVVISYVAALIAISWRLTLLALVVAPLLMLFLQPLLRKLRAGYRRIGNQHGEMTSVVQEVIGGIRLVKSFGAEGYEERRFLDASGKYSSAMVRVTRIAYLAQPITEVVGTVIAVALLWIGARQVLVSHTLQPAQLIVFLTFVMRLLQPLKQLAQIPPTAQQSLAASERLFEVLDLPTEAQLDKGTRTTATFERTLAFENVSFAYNEDPVLSDINFTAKRGEVIAIVGPSGAGKSTLVDLIPRFYEPTSGRILLDGVDTREMKLPALRSLTGIVSQDTVLFHDTVKSNIAYGNTERFTAEQIEAAARAANAHEFIARLPEGYDTILGERGARLSGGQRQRLAIARALLVDPPILILDEATSSLDTESERLVQQAIDRLLEGRTVFVIAHRLSTIEHADQILVLEDGRIVERGGHEQLLGRGGAYHRLHSMQFRERAPATSSAS
jgi:ATP-binding cassette, subfamily B, bacterial MsbA